MNTDEIQSAIDSAHKAGGGKVVVPEGVFLSGSIYLKSNVQFHLENDAVLLGSTNPDDYQGVQWLWKGLVLAKGAENISITGNGTIDGQGRELALHLDSLFYSGHLDSSDYNFVERRPKYYLRPQLIYFFDCNDIEIRNVTLRNSSCWVQSYDQCVNLLVDSVVVDSDAYWNNDGIDIIDCKNVRLTNLDINASDDGICLKSHDAGKLCEDVFISNCRVRSSASAVKLGTKSLGGFKNIVIQNIKVYDTFRSAIALESVDGGILENIVVDGVEASNTGNALFIKLGHRVKKEQVATLKNVVIRNLSADIAFERPDYKYEVRGPALPFFHNTFPSSITGLPGYNVENLVLENLDIRYPGKGNRGLAWFPITRLDQVPENGDHYPEFSMFGELPAWGLYVRHVKGLVMKNVRFGIAEPDYRPSVVLDDVEGLVAKDLEVEGDNKSINLVLKDVTGEVVKDSVRAYRIK